jgi:threonine synthase
VRRRQVNSSITHHVCSRCGTSYGADEKIITCRESDDGRLDIFYDYELAKETLTKEAIQQRPRGVWRYFELLPLQNTRNIVTLAEGATPLLRCERLGRELGLKELYVKDETRNPTASFKDRAMTVGVSKAVEFKAETVASASTGNAAASLSAFSAKAGLTCYAFVHENAPSGKLAQLACTGARVVRVRNLETAEDPVVKMLKLVTEKYGWYPCPSFGPFNPYQFEGAKTIAYEVVEQLDWSSPDWAIIPIGGGGVLGANWRGFLEAEILGLVNGKPKIAGVQAEGCAPVVRAFKEGQDPLSIQPWTNPRTVAGGLRDPIPWDGDAALKAMKDSGGTAEAVSDEEILEAEKLLARKEGVFAEPSGAASIACLIKMIKKGILESDECIVAAVTGSGLKDPTTVAQMFPQPQLINPTIEEFEALAS